MKRKTFFALVSLLAILLVLAACAPTNPGTGEVRYTQATVMNPPSTNVWDRTPWVAGDKIYFSSKVTNFNIYVATWNGDGTCGEPTELATTINTAADEINPCVIENDGKLIMYFGRYTGTERDYDFFRSEFNSETSEWGEAVKVDELSSVKKEWDIWINGNETVAYFTSYSPTFDGSTTVEGSKINVWESEMTETGWATPTLFDGLSTDANQYNVFVDPNGLIWYDDNSDIYCYDPVNGTNEKFDDRVNSAKAERSFWTDGKYMIFTSFRSDDPNYQGSYDLYIVNID